MRSALKALLGGLALAAFGAAHAQAYPDRPIKLIITYPAGGSTDTVGRVVGGKLSELLGQPVVIDNKGGASGTLGASIAAKSPPDGYTLMLAAGAHALAESVIANLQYNLARDFVPVALVAQSGYLLVLNPAIPANSVSELITLAKSRPGKLNFASTGVGSTPHLAMALFNSLTDTKMTNIPYKGDTPAIADLIGGQVDVGFVGTSSVSPHVASGKLKALAVSTEKRTSAAPQLPTVAEAGVKDYEFSTWWGIVAPAGTPRAVVEKLSDALEKVVASPDVKERFKGLGIDAVYMRSDAFAPYLKGSIEKYATIAKGAGVKPE
jgi:tripartite-type tricarboxylate transporter receptor subunit TctC